MTPAAQEIIDRCPKDRDIVGAEVGVWFGRTSTALLKDLPRLHLYMIDWYRVLATPEERNRCSIDAHIGQDPDQMNNARLSAEKATEFAANRRSIVVMPDCIAAAWLPDEHLDFAFLDADHTYEGTREAIQCYWPLVKPGGFLCGHDYGDTRNGWGVKPAVDEFYKAAGLRLQLGGDRTWFITKPGGQLC